ncbi:MAG: FAD-dependent oxidoreductase [Cyanobacteria bacterium J06642_2]
MGSARRSLSALALSGAIGLSSVPVTLSPVAAQPDLNSVDITTCDILIAGGGLSGSAVAYESLQAGHTVCMTDITDWVGGQISSQGVSALDEAKKQRSLLYYSQGYNELRQRIEDFYGQLNPGGCWVSVSCYMPKDAHTILQAQLLEAAERGNGELKWFPNTVIKDLEYSSDGSQITGAIAIQHSPASGAAPLNTDPLSEAIEDAYSFDNSERFDKAILRFGPTGDREGPADWYVVEATETGELIALADVPYRLGIDPQSSRNPSSPSVEGDPYCTQGFTYTFAMERTERDRIQTEPEFYEQYAPYYSYEKPRDGFNATDYFDFVFTYRRIWNPAPRSTETIFGTARPAPGDISMQNWTWGNDYRPGTEEDNLIYTREQLEARGELEPGGWMGGLRVDSLRNGEENALGYYYWLVEGTTDSQVEGEVKEPFPNHKYLSGFDTPMGTAHGLSKYPYIREGRRIIGRPSYAYTDGFSIAEVDISRADYTDEYYINTLEPNTYRSLWRALAGVNVAAAIANDTPPDEIARRTRSTIYPDAIGIAQYAIDFHPCMTLHPPEAPGNNEREGIRRAHGQAYPAQIPLRATIPQKLDNLLVAGKSIATSHVAAAAYRVHSFEWSVGAAVGTAIDFALEKEVMPYELVDDLPRREPLLQELQTRLQENGNPTAFPDTSIFNEDWEEWGVW